MATRLRAGAVSVAALSLLLLATSVEAARYPGGFSEEVVLDGLTQPTQAAFAPDGRIVVVEKSGVVKVFDGPGDDAPDVLIDLSPAIHDYWDRGMLGLALDPGFPERPYVYVLYTHNFDAVDPAAGEPRWPTNDCPSPPGPNLDGCVVNGRLSRLEVGPANELVGGEQLLLEGGWCAQFPSHTVGTLAFDAAGALYVTAGEGANALEADWGQLGGSQNSPIPPNPCDDPPAGRGTALSPPDAEGGALRAQDLRTDGDPVSWSGAVLRIDPTTGSAWPTNPRVGGDPADDRVVAYGLRNPFRVAHRPGTSELWIGDVGWRTWEEINRLTVPATGDVPNFGWPCYEGAARQSDYDNADLQLCETLYDDQQAPALEPFFSYRRGEPVTPESAAFRCSRFGGSAISGLAFLDEAGGGNYPDEYGAALFFADFPRQCIFFLRAGSDGMPDPATRATFGDGIPAVVQLLIGPEGALHFLDLANGRLVRIAYTDSNTPPTAVATADVTDGSLPLTVRFDATQSTDPDEGATLTYSWDLDGDGVFGDSTLIDPTQRYDVASEYPVGLRVTDERGASGSDTLVVTAGNTAPEVAITAPAPDLRWRAGQEIAFAGTATDAEDGTLPPAAFRWEVLLHVCHDDPGDCTAHTVAVFEGVREGTLAAPDQPGDVRLELALSVTDEGFGDEGGGGVLAGSARRDLEPQTVTLDFDTRPSGLELAVDGSRQTTPFTRITVVGATSLVAAPDPQTGRGGVYRFLFWSDGGAATHPVTAPQDDARLEAEFVFDCLDGDCIPVLRVSPGGTPPAPFRAVQDAVDAATAGTRIEVLPGTYVENVVVERGFPITIAARDDGSGGAVTIDGAVGGAFRLAGTAPVTLSGFTLAGAFGVRAAAPTVLTGLHVGPVTAVALDLTDAAHDVRDLTVAPGAAAGIAVAFGADLELDRARIAAASGAALAVAGAARVRNLLAHGNGTGVTVASGASLDLAHATIVDNVGAGLLGVPGGPGTDGSTIAARATVLWGNGGGDATSLSCADLRWTDSSRADCAGQNGNLSVDPALDASFRPLTGSPLIDAGPAPDGGGVEPCSDLDRGLRWRDGDGDGAPRADPGAFEWADPARPPSIEDLAWVSPDELNWTRPPRAATHHVYRGSVAEALAGTLPCADAFDPDRTDAVFRDAATPPPGELVVYLVVAERNDGGAGSAGPRTCAERTLLSPCP